MDDLLDVIQKDPRIRIKSNDMLDRYNRLPYTYQPRI